MPYEENEMKFIPQSIPDVLLIELIVHRDERGYVVETFRLDMLDQILGYKVNFIQDFSYMFLLILYLIIIFLLGY